jgi:DNA-binding Lrp family transcriptional regulator
VAHQTLDEIETEATPVENIDGVDYRILNLLQQDARLSFNKIASKLGISVGTAFNHIKSLEKKGILKGYTIKLNSDKIGYGLTALTLIQTEGGHLSEVEDRISKTGNVIAVYNITGDYDAAVITKFKDRDGLSSFLKSLMATPHVRRTVTSVVLEVVKEDLRVELHNTAEELPSDMPRK